MGIGFGDNQTLATVDALSSSAHNISVLLNNEAPPRTPTPFSSTLDNSGDCTEHKNSPIDSVHFGYNQKLGNSPFFIGVEGYSFYSDATLKLTRISSTTGSNAIDTTSTPLNLNYNQTSTAEVTVKSDSFGYGFSLRFAFLITPTTLIYTPFGFAKNKVKLNSGNRFQVQDTISNPDQEPVPATLVTNDFSQVNTTKSTLHGRMAGVGVEQLISKSLSVGLEYNRVAYDDLSLEDVSDTTGGAYVLNPGEVPSFTPVAIPDGASSSNKLSLKTNSIRFVLRYCFGGF
jgi:opacity protein-like surface antigen